MQFSEFLKHKMPNLIGDNSKANNSDDKINPDAEAVNAAVEKHNRLVEGGVSGIKNLDTKKVGNDAEGKIETYINRLENIFLNEDMGTRERNINMLRAGIYDILIIKKENVPESYFELQKQIARDQGHGEIEISPETKRQMIEVLIGDQKASLDAWIDYLTGPDAVYPAWFKFLAFRNIIKLSQFDKTLLKFKDRTDSTVAPFPDIYREPLAQLCDIYEKYLADPKLKNDPDYKVYIEKKFATSYASLIQKSLENSLERKDGTVGEWRKFNQGNSSDATELYESLKNKGTGWCTAGDSTARTQIEGGDFYVYYTYDDEGNPVQPRVAIRMNGKNKIAELRGVNPSQELEPQFADIVDEKMNEFGADEAKVYKKKASDMKRLTEAVRKNEKQEDLTEGEIRFLYGNIQGFGYQVDPRIEELKKKRDYFADMRKVFKSKVALDMLDKCEKNNDISISIDLSFDGLEFHPLNLRPLTRDEAYAEYMSGPDNPEITRLNTRLNKQFTYTTPTPKNLNVYMMEFDSATLKSSDLIVAKMQEYGMRPLTYEEMLQHNIKNPTHQKQSLLIVLGTKKMFGSVARVPCAGWGGSRRILGAGDWDGGWDSDIRFPAVPIEE